MRKRPANWACRALFIGILVALAGCGALLAWMANRGLSARDEPTAAEEFAARSFRRLAAPRAVRNLQNPIPQSQEALAAGREHFADHCASCHANDGSGNTAIGRGLYPKAPDMRLQATQSLMDGELFSIIRNGIRLTGMPAWGSGTPEDDLATWKLVHFIRHLPRITAEELAEMRRLNPRSPEEIRREQEIEQFLAGGGGSAEDSTHRE
jgi:mono/diheme cytochrome c family protein